jgi:Zn-dependent protease with chaperone function
MIARSTPWFTIQTGKEFGLLSRMEQDAILAHERGHLVHFHAWKRILWIVSLMAFFRTADYFALCRKQELEADQYAVKKGHRHGLMMFLIALDKTNAKHQTASHPTLKERIRVLYG